MRMTFCIRAKWAELRHATRADYSREGKDFGACEAGHIFQGLQSIQYGDVVLTISVPRSLPEESRILCPGIFILLSYLVVSPPLTDRSQPALNPFIPPCKTS